MEDDASPSGETTTFLTGRPLPRNSESGADVKFMVGVKVLNPGEKAPKKRRKAKKSKKKKRKGDDDEIGAKFFIMDECSEDEDEDEEEREDPAAEVKRVVTLTGFIARSFVTSPFIDYTVICVPEDVDRDIFRVIGLEEAINPPSEVITLNHLKNICRQLGVEYPGDHVAKKTKKKTPLLAKDLSPDAPAHFTRLFQYVWCTRNQMDRVLSAVTYCSIHPTDLPKVLNSIEYNQTKTPQDFIVHMLCKHGPNVEYLSTKEDLKKSLSIMRAINVHRSVERLREDRKKFGRTCVTNSETPLRSLEISDKFGTLSKWDEKALELFAKYFPEITCYEFGMNTCICFADDFKAAQSIKDFLERRSVPITTYESFASTTCADFPFFLKKEKNLNPGPARIMEIKAQLALNLEETVEYVKQYPQNTPETREFLIERREIAKKLNSALNSPPPKPISLVILVPNSTTKRTLDQRNVKNAILGNMFCASMFTKADSGSLHVAIYQADLYDLKLMARIFEELQKIETKLVGIDLIGISSVKRYTVAQAFTTICCVVRPEETISSEDDLMNAIYPILNRKFSFSADTQMCTILTDNLDSKSKVMHDLSRHDVQIWTTVTLYDLFCSKPPKKSSNGTIIWAPRTYEPRDLHEAIRVIFSFYDSMDVWFNGDDAKVIEHLFRVPALKIQDDLFSQLEFRRTYTNKNE